MKDINPLEGQHRVAVAAMRTERQWKLDLFRLLGVKTGERFHSPWSSSCGSDWAEQGVMDTHQNAGKSHWMLGKNPGTAFPKELRILVFGDSHSLDSLNWTLLEQGFKTRVTVAFSCFTAPQFFSEKSIKWLKLLNGGFLLWTKKRIELNLTWNSFAWCSILDDSNKNISVGMWNNYNCLLWGEICLNNLGFPEFVLDDVVCSKLNEVFSF